MEDSMETPDMPIISFAFHITCDILFNPKLKMLL